VWKTRVLEAGWRILVSKELLRNGAAELKERLPVSILTGEVAGEE